MKKRLLIFGLVFAMLMTALMPAPVMAASEKSNARGPFKADGQAFVAAAGTIIDQKKLGKNITVIKKVGEVIAGQIASCPEWTEFTGTSFQIVENCTTTLNMQNNKLNSIAIGTVTVMQGTTPVMTGKYGAVMHGDFTGNDIAQLVFNEVIDLGTIELKGIPGTAFAGADVKGTVYANLALTQVAPGVYTLVGPLTIKGTRS